MINLNAIFAIAYRDLIKFLRDPGRVFATLIFPIIFIGILGGSLQSNLGSGAGYDFLTFTFTGVFAQTLFQSAALGLISLVADRENDFSQEIFVSPISRYAIIFGKILGESLVAFSQGIAILLFGLVIGITYTSVQLLSLLITGVIACFFGGAFGVLILANLKNQRAAEQIFPLVMLPQLFLAGVFNPIKVLPLYVDILSRIAPLRYAVDLTRGMFYAGQPDYDAVVLNHPAFNLALMGAMFSVFMLAGTWLFVRSERNR